MNEKNNGGKTRFIDQLLNAVERIGNKLPDPAILFVIAMVVTWVVSAFMDGLQFSIRSATGTRTEAVKSQLTGDALAQFLEDMVETFTGFHPLGVVLVALLGVGVAERSGFINAALKGMLSFTPKKLLTPMLILVAIVSHTAADAGYVLVIPLGGVIFYAAGRHPLAGIMAAFAGVSGGFSANFIPSGIDPLLSGLTQTGVDLVDKTHGVNPLCNYYFTSASSILIIAVGWFLTDRIIEPRLQATEVDGDPEDMPKMEPMTPNEKRGLSAGFLAMVAGLLALFVVSVPSDSAMRPPPSIVIEAKDGQTYEGTEAAAPEQFHALAAEVADLPPSAWLQSESGGLYQAQAQSIVVRGDISGKSMDELFYNDAKAKKVAVIARDQIEKTEDKAGSLTNLRAPIMASIVPLIFLLFLIPGVVHGYVSRSFTNHRDVVKGMAKSMETMGYYLVMAFFASLFIYAFNQSNLGALLAVTGANFLETAGFPPAVTICGIIFLCASVNLLVGSASAKWAMLAPIFVPMLMQLGYSPELTQAAYRVGDSSTNIITPLMPYFPLVVAFSQRYVKKTGIGTVTSLMLPYSISFIVLWTLFLLLWWMVGVPLGIGGDFTYALPS